MTQDDIVVMARQAGFWKDLFAYPEFKEHLESFAKLVAAKEQEPACSGCGKTNTPDSQWACYCVDCWTKAQPEQETQAYREAAQLAKWLFKTHYAQEEHYASGRVVWGLCDTTAGVISQIDNMVCKLVLPKELEQEPMAHSVIAGALFDFMGWLTSRKERLVLSSADEASPAVDAIRDFAKMRGMSLDDAKVQDWNTTPPQRTWVHLTNQEHEEIAIEWGCLSADWVFYAAAVERKVKEKNT